MHYVKILCLFIITKPSTQIHLKVHLYTHVYRIVQNYVLEMTTIFTIKFDTNDAIKIMMIRGCTQ